MLLDAGLDAVLDSLKLLPFLFVTYFFMEWLEHGAGDKFEKAVAKAGKAGPFIGAVLGVVPQCGFSGAAATLYAGRVVTLGTLVAVFLVTSDEMLPVMLSQAVEPVIIAKVIGIKLVVGMATGFVLDAVLRMLGKEHVGFGAAHSHEGHHGYDIRQLCEMEGCDCSNGCECDSCEKRAELIAKELACSSCGHVEHAHDHEHEHEHGHDHGHGHDHSGHAGAGHLALAALKHSLQITVFVFIICFALNLIVEAGLEDAIAVVATTPFVGSFVAAVLGLIPNCAVSVALTQLYLDGVLTGGAMMSGLAVNAGIGLIVLFRTNNDSRENMRICGLLVVIGIVVGLLVELSGIL